MPPFIATLFARVGITGIIIAVFAALLVVQTVRLEGFKIWPLKYTGAIERAEKAKAAAVACEVRHSVTRASLEKLIDRNTAMIEAGKARTKAAEKALEAQKDRSAVLDSQIASIRSERAVAAPVGQECKSPESVLEAEGL